MHEEEVKLYTVNKFPMETMITLEKEALDEVARSSLIAISQSIPEMILPFTAPSFTKVIIDANLSDIAKDTIGTEDYRSELISISDSHSAEPQPLKP
ncbi:uncharacterized protein A4U43_C04F17310 [Asparagus officinalis]|uniref:Uncharacterized protein n=1 Tax=Asparagus officinalis TaxID=4686 RepID=A0A5P1F6E6_ASPOF|nr:uncharacterized protein A4U43_C04F17310 [Asparagus officinalis]